ncbi:MAG TPA: dihydroorotate dehydrogenase electron transfer subunit [Vicinamibacteria bacterium]|nr:dihydroorotate dehydrogenase electron transfer subunit [Vicinamibacteria bacterium]
MKRDESSVLVERQQLSPDAFLLHFESETLSGSFRPGQFTMVRIPDRSDLLLRRPYSFCDSRPEDRSFSLLVKIAGKGTRALPELPVGGRADCLGPLGSSFRLPREGRRPLVVAGGVGIAPFVAFCRELARDGTSAIVLLGGRSASDLYLRSEFEALGMDVRTSTEDGTYGHRGLVTDLLAKVFEGGEPLELYSCGPTPMLLRVAAMAREKRIPHQVSLERRMGCGMGCCLGCVVYTRSEAQSEYLRSCTEGPVFDAESVVWEKDPYPL